jgi:hypothetical protein
VGTLSMARALAASDARLATQLAARAGSDEWEQDRAKDDAAFTSPGWRAVADKKFDELGARLPATADGAFEVGIAQFANTRLSLTPEGTARVAGAVRDGHVVYPGAYGDAADLVVTATHRELEELFVLRDASAPRSFVWDVALPKGIARVVARRDGSLAFVDHGGKSVLAMPRWTRTA